MSLTWNKIVLAAEDQTGPAFNSVRSNLSGLKTDAQGANAALSGASKPLDQMGLSAKQTAAALRGVPAQFTDIITSLQGGQAPLTVFLQQGGQLKDMFGGAGAAAKALGGYVLGLINPITLSAAAAGALALAYYQGSKEVDNYNKALALSGNISGTTVGHLQGMARAMADTGRTQSASAAAMAEMAQSSSVAADSLQRYTSVAMDWENVTGQAVGKTAEAFKSLGQDPLKASLKLNEGLNYLTASTYEHIKSLTEQGKTVDAARVAQEAYADSLAGRTRMVTQNLGFIERGWNAVTGAAKSAWDAMLNVGRASTQADRIAGIDKELADLNARSGAGFASNGGGAAFGRPDAAAQARTQARIQFLQAEKAAISGVMEAERQRAEQQAADAARVKEKATWDEKGLAFLSKQQQMEREIASAREQGTRAGVAAADIEARINAIREKFTEKGGARSAAMKAESAAAKLLADDLARLAESAGLSPSFYKDWEALNDMHKRDKLSVEQLTEAQAKLLAKQPAMKAAADEQTKAQNELTKAREKFATDQSRYLLSLDEETRGMQERNAALQDEIARMGMSTRQLADHERARLGVAIAKQEEKLATIALFGATEEETAALRDQIAALKERQSLVGQRAQQEEYLGQQRQLVEFWGSVDQTAHDVFVNIFEDGAGTFKRLGQTLKSAVLDMLYQLTVKRWIINIGASMSGNQGAFTQAMGGQGGLFGSASNASSLMNLFGGTGGNMGAISGLLNGGMSFANAAGSVFANTASGMGMYGGNSLNALLAGNGAYGTAGAGVGMGTSIAGLAAVAAPLVVGMLAERNSRDRYGGAAFATSDWRNDPFVATRGNDFDAATGAIPDRLALIERAIAAGIGQPTLDKFGTNDRALLHYVRLAEEGGWGENRLLPDPSKLIQESNLYGADFYRGQGYANPESIGWWSDKGPDLLANDPKVNAASRAIAESVVAPFTSIARALGMSDDFRVTAGFANRGQGATWGNLSIQQGDRSLFEMGQRDFEGGAQDYMRSVYSETLGALKELDLPQWAQTQVDGARAQIDKLTGDEVGTQAASLYDQATASIGQTITAIASLIKVIPDFAGASQDAVFAITSSLGGLEGFSQAYGSYMQNFYSDAERQAIAMGQLSEQFAALDITMPSTMDAFRDLVEAQDLTTEAGQQTYAALIGLSGAFAELNSAAEVAFGVAFGAASELAGLIAQGLLGTFDGESLGVAMAQTVQDGVYAAIAGSFAQQITDIIVGGVVNPVIQAAVTGSSISAAVSQSSIDAMVAQASAVASAYAAIVNDPAFQAAMDQIGAAVSSIGGSYTSYTSYNPAPVRSYTSAVIDSGMAAEKAADKIKDAWKDIADSLLDEVARIRGEIADSGQNSTAYWQSLFAMDTAAARAGDQEAAGRLTGLSSSLLQAMEREAGSLFELQQMRAWVAQSLQDTAGYATRYGGGAAPVPTAPASPSIGFTLTRPELPIAGVPFTTNAPNDSATRDLALKVQELTEQNREQAARMAELQLQLVRVFRRWDEEGMPAERVEA